jgi:membrane protease subunit (stomatin/prohibitin family)
MKNSLLSDIDEQYKSSFVKQIEKELKYNQEEISALTNENLKLKKEIKELKAIILSQK